MKNFSYKWCPSFCNVKTLFLWIMSMVSLITILLNSYKHSHNWYSIIWRTCSVENADYLLDGIMLWSLSYSSFLLLFYFLHLFISFITVMSRQHFSASLFSIQALCLFPNLRLSGKNIMVYQLISSFYIFHFREVFKFLELQNLTFFKL